MTAPSPTQTSRAPRQLVWALVALTASVALAAVAAWPIYHTPRVAIVAAGGLVIGIASVLGARALRWGPWGAAGLGLLGYVLAVVPLAVPSAMTDPGRAVRAAVDALAQIVTGWKQLLTVSMPSGTYQGVLVPFLIVVLAGSLAAVGLATSSKRIAPWAAAPMVAMVVFGAAFGSDATGADVTLGPVTIPAPWHVLVGGTAVIVAGAWLIVRARIERSAALRAAWSRASTVKQSRESMGFAARRHAVAVSLVIVALAAGVAAAPLSSLLGPRDALRENVDPVLMLQRQASPLAAYRAHFAPPQYEEELFSFTGGEGVERVRIATLDTYDGQTFHVADADEGERFSRQPHLQGDDMVITIGPGYTGVWVPIVDAEDGAPRFLGARAEELSEAFYASAGLDAAVVVTASSGQGVGLRAGDRYSVSTDSSLATLDTLSSSRGADPLIAAEDFPALAQWVKQQDVGRNGSDLVELVERLKARGYLSHASADGASAEGWIASLKTESRYSFEPSRSGHSTARVEEMFTALFEQQQRAGGRAEADALVAAIGDDEQFAVATALLARYLGFESRVVIGVKIGSETTSGVPPCDAVCTGANVTAWAEVRNSDQDWVALDVTPQHEVSPSLIKPGESPPKNATEVDPEGSAVLEPPSSQSDVTDAATSDPSIVPEQDDTTVTTILAVLTGVLAVALVVLPLLVFPVAKAMRRTWRRHAGVPEVAMVGAWDELLDTYTDLGIDLPDGLTRAELADVLGRPAAATLATIVDRAVFAEHPPGAEASQATWGLLLDERRAVASEATFRRRVRAKVTPASFLRTIRSTQRHGQSSARLTGRTQHDF